MVGMASERSSWKMQVQWFYWLLAYVSFTPDLVYASYKEIDALNNNLLTDYNINVLPQVSTGEPVIVSFDASLNSINHVDSRKQTISVDLIIAMSWFDARLQWNSTKYNGTDILSLSNDQIWTPDVNLYNRAPTTDPNVYTDLFTSRITVFNSGFTRWSNLITFDASCNLNLKWFPLDTQNCSLNFGSWSYHIDYLKLEEDKLSLQASEHFSVKNGEWNIDSSTISSEEIDFDCCKEPFSRISYTLVLTRLSLYYFLYILLPVIGLSFLCLFVFIIPPDSGERLGFGVTVLLSISVYLLVISDILPHKSDDTPALGVCFIAIMFILAVAIGFATLTMHFADWTTKPPQWLLGWMVNGLWHRKKEINVSKTELELSATSTDAAKSKVGGMAHINVEAISQNGELEAVFKDTSDDKEKTDENKDWVKIGKFVDKQLFTFFVLILIAIPTIIVLSM